jgi:hypothetical protein
MVRRGAFGRLCAFGGVLCAVRLVAFDTVGKCFGLCAPCLHRQQDHFAARFGIRHAAPSGIHVQGAIWAGVKICGAKNDVYRIFK